MNPMICLLGYVTVNTQAEGCVRTTSPTINSHPGPVAPLVLTCSTEWCFTVHFWATSGNVCLPSVQPAALSLPHKAPS